MSGKNKLDTKEPTQLKLINLNEIIKPLWIKLSTNDFLSLIKDVVNNLDNKNYRTTINNNKYDLKIAEQFLLEKVTKKNLIEPKVIELTRGKSSRGKNKTLDILQFTAM